MNGVEIYDKDIGWNEYNESYGRIIWRDGAYYFEWENITELLSEICGEIEVKGNTCQNPDLLNKVIIDEWREYE